MKKNINRTTLDEGLRLSNLAYSNKTIENGIASAYIEETEDLIKIGFTGTDEQNDWWHNLNFMTDDLRTLVNKEQDLIDNAEEVDRRRLGDHKKKKIYQKLFPDLYRSQVYNPDTIFIMLEALSSQQVDTIYRMYIGTLRGRANILLRRVYSLQLPSEQQDDLINRIRQYVLRALQNLLVYNFLQARGRGVHNEYVNNNTIAFENLEKYINEVVRRETGQPSLGQVEFTQEATPGDSINADSEGFNVVEGLQAGPINYLTPNDNPADLNFSNIISLFQRGFNHIHFVRAPAIQVDYDSDYSGGISDFDSSAYSHTDLRRRIRGGSGVPEGLQVHLGFYDHLNLIYRQVADRIGNKNYEIAGHSLGGAMATIFAIRYYGETGKLPVSVITFGSPRVFYGDTKPYEDLIDIIRVAIIDDAVVFMPPLKLGWKHVGTPVLYNMANMVTPTIMDKGFDEDQLATFFLNELVSSVRTITLNTGYKMAVGGLASKLTNNIIKPLPSGEISTESMFNQESFYPNNLEVRKRLEVGKEIYKSVKDRLDGALTGLSVTREAEIDQVYGAVLDEADTTGVTSLTQGLIDRLSKDLEPLFSRLSGDMGSRLKATLQESAADINTAQTTIQLEAASKSFARQTSISDEIFELLTASRKGKIYDEAIENLIQELTQTSKDIDPIIFGLGVMNTIFGFTQMGLTIATYWTLLNHAYNTYRAVHFHGLDLYQSLVDSMPVEHRNTILDNFYNEYKFVGTDDSGNKIYEDFDGNRFILAGGKEGVYLESISTEPKILGYIHLTKDIQAGSVVVYE